MEYSREYSPTVEKFVYSSVFDWNVLDISTRSIWYNVSFKVMVSLLIFWLDDLSIYVSVFSIVLL